MAKAFVRISLPPELLAQLTPLFENTTNRLLVERSKLAAKTAANPSVTANRSTGKITPPTSTLPKAGTAKRERKPSASSTTLPASPDIQAPLGGLFDLI